MGGVDVACLIDARVRRGQRAAVQRHLTQSDEDLVAVIAERGRRHGAALVDHDRSAHIHVMDAPDVTDAEFDGAAVDRKDVRISSRQHRDGPGPAEL